MGNAVCGHLGIDPAVVLSFYPLLQLAHLSLFCNASYESFHFLRTRRTRARSHIHRLLLQRGSLWRGTRYRLAQWILACLPGVMIIQTYLYFTTFTNDKTWKKTFVVCIFVLDTFNTFFDFAYLYGESPRPNDSLIIHFGDVSFLAQANWLFATDPVMTATIAFLIQLFYAWRVKVLTGKLWLALFVAACSLAGLVGGIATTVEVLLVPHFSDFIHFKVVVIVWLVSECVADVLITTILVTHLCVHIPFPPPKITLSKNRTSPRRLSHKTGIEDSDMLIDRIIRITMQTGLAASLCATIDLILFLTDPIALHLVFNIPLCKLYTNSLLSSLNARNVRGPESADSGKTELGVSKSVRMSGQPPPRFRSSVFIDVESIRVSDASGAGAQGVA
ncbi:hypothetical protein B0H19DRAFT_1248422 [Mycena capillaripes]|nr:hypothetical protein B0H19DRAFT_1248422 [Mycena capillaripes]